jgi:hypothetical protein
MSFGAELKDFASGFRTGKQIQYEQARTDYYGGRNDATAKKNGFDFDATKASMSGQPGARKGGLLNWLDRTFNGEPNKAVAPITTAAPGTTPGATAASPTSSVQAVSTAPTQGYVAANSGAPAARVSDTSTLDDGDPDQYGAYSRGGAVRAYADGGAVMDDQDVPDAPPPPPPQQMASLPPPPQQTAVPAPAAAAPAPDEDPALSKALHAGLMTLQDRNGLRGQQPSAVAGQQTQQGQARLMSGADAASPEDMEAARKAVDPNGELSESQLNVRVMEKGYQYYEMHGEPEKAANYAAMIIQYTSNEAQKLGQTAVQQMRGGDLKAGAATLERAASIIPNGTHPADTKVNDDGSVTTTEVDTRTGKPIATHTMSGQQLFNMALGLQNKTGYYSAIMTAASKAKGYEPPPSDAYTGAMNDLGGVNADGSLKQAVPTGAQTAPSGAPAPQGQQPAAPQANAPQTSAAIPAYMKMMSGGESSNNPKITNGQSAGLYQIQPAAWKQATGHDPIVNGKDERLDPAKNTAVMQAVTQQNASQFKGIFQRDASPLELAVMHQQGARGGMYLMASAQDEPDAPAAQVLARAGQKNPQSALTQNGIPANATAAQAVKLIQAHYAKYGSNGVTQPGNADPDASGILPARPEDQVAAPDVPNRPTTPATPTMLRADPQRLAGMQPDENKNYIRTIASQNLANKKQFSIDQGKFNDENKAYQQQVAANKAPKPTAPLKLDPRDNEPLATAITGAMPDQKADPTDPIFSLSAGAQKIVPDVAFGVKVANPELSPHQAVLYSARLLKMSANKGQIGRAFTAYDYPKNPQLVRAVFGTGDSLLVPKNTYMQITQRHISDFKDLQPKPVANTGPTLAGRAGRAALNIAAKTPGAVFDATTAGLNAVNDGLTAVPGAIAGGAKAIGNTVADVVSHPGRAINNAFLDQQNQRP